MSRTLHHILAIAALALLTLGVGSCVEPLDPSLRPEGPSVTFWIYVPGNMQQPVTKALPGDVASQSPESVLQDVQVWAFRHGAGDTEAALSYVDVSSINWSHTGTTPRSWSDCYKMSMYIPEDFLKESDPRIDFYILANWRSIFGSKPSAHTTLSQVRDLMYNSQVGYFGVTNPTREVPQTGLPISTIYAGEEGEGVSLKFLKDAIEAGQKPDQKLFEDNLEVIELKRTVSKLRFVFSRPKGVDNVSVTRIVVDRGLIPDQNWVFEKDDPILPATATYDGSLELKGADDDTGTATPLLPSSAIGETKDPQVLSGAWFEENKPSGYAQTAQGYDNYLRDSISASKATEVVTYLRETDKALTGTVYYKLSNDANAVEYSAQFTMGKLDDEYNNFHRNHYWTVYAYFEPGGLNIKPIALPWEGAGKYDFSTPGTAYVSISEKIQAIFGYGWSSSTENDWYDGNKPTEWYFRRQDEGKPWSDWVHSQMISAPGLNLANAPVFANRIELSTTGFTEPLRLKLSDTQHFYLVIYHSESASYDIVDAAAGAEIPATVAANGVSYFYVVPRDGDAHEGEKTSAYLVTAQTGQKLPFNAGAFPGSNENTEIYFYSVSQDTFKGYYFELPDSVKAYGKSGEIDLD